MGRKAATKATPEKEVNDLAKAQFIAALMDGATITVAAETAGIDRKTAYRWRESDADFGAAWDEALEAGTDRLEEEAIRRARDGVTKPVFQGGQEVGQVQEYSDTLLIFMLKARRPDKFRERLSVSTPGKDGKEQPLAPAGVLVVPGLVADTAAWSQQVQKGQLPGGA